MTTIFLIRHGQNEYVGQGRLAGWLPDVHLNDAGRAQAQALVDLFKEVKLQAIYSSPLDRTLETAIPLAEAQGLKPLSRPGLGEVRYGTWEGKTLKSLRRRKLWRVVQWMPSLARFPDGESFPEAQNRIVTELEHLRAQHRGKKDAIACVSHSDMIKLAIAHYMGLPIDLFQRLTIHPASISILAIGEQGIRLFRLNDTRATLAGGQE
jgi:probable phosphoglycerate mutase